MRMWQALGWKLSVKDNNFMLRRLNHIAIAVPDLREATAFYRDILKVKVSEPHKLPEHGVTTVFIELDNTKLELLEPLGDNSLIASFIQKNPAGGIHHFCIEVEDVTVASAYLKERNIRTLADPKPGAHGTNVIFLHPKDCHGCLVELEEAKD